MNPLTEPLIVWLTGFLAVFIVGFVIGFLVERRSRRNYMFSAEEANTLQPVQAMAQEQPGIFPDPEPEEEEIGPGDGVVKEKIEL